jgi:uncharacterized membrane protein YeiH
MEMLRARVADPKPSLDRRAPGDTMSVCGAAAQPGRPASVGTRLKLSKDNRCRMQNLTSIMTMVDLIAVAVFAVTGALVASRKQMDIVAFCWLGLVTGVGGGTVRDLLLGQPVFWVREPAYVITCLVAATAVYFTAHIPNSRYRLLLWLDAVGLALVTVAGTAKGLDAGAGPVVAIVMGVITAALGGIIRDILGHEPSIILRKEIYVTASVAGALVLVAAIGLGIDRAPAMALGFAVALGVRGVAIATGWSLPTYRARAGRTIDEIENLK